MFNRAVGPYANDESTPGARNVFEEYFYDALGRRVLVRARRTWSCSVTIAECNSHVDRTVWDGDQVIFEIRAKGGSDAALWERESDNGWYSGNDAAAFGQVGYVHAGGIDQPLLVLRAGFNGQLPIAVYPHQNWRGMFELGTASDGTLRSSTIGYPQIAWPGAQATLDGELPNKADGPVWFREPDPGQERRLRHAVHAEPLL